jgi:hypothetical protein
MVQGMASALVYFVIASLFTTSDDFVSLGTTRSLLRAAILVSLHRNIIRVVLEFMGIDRVLIIYFEIIN